MSQWVLELNDAAIRVTRDGALVDVSPGVAVVRSDAVLTGAQAAAARWLDPRATFDRFWQQPGEQPLPGATRQVRHHADLLYHHLAAILARCGRPRQAVLAVPAHYGDAELALVLGITRALELDVTALVDMSVAALAGCAAPGSYTVATLYLHHATLVDVDVDTACTRGAVVTIESVARQRLEHACRDLVADAFLEQARFDPLHAAESEQQLADALPGWLAQAGAAPGEEIELSLRHAGRAYQARVAARELARISAMVLGALAERGPPGRDLVLEAELAALPGARGVLGATAVLSPDAAAAGILLHAPLRAPGAATCFLGALPAAPSPTLARSATQVATTAAPTHLLYGAHARAAGGDARTLNADGSLGGGDVGHAASVRRADGRLLLDPGATTVTLNGRRLRGEAVLATGDRVRVGGTEFLAIHVD
ncbi:MAG: FHA domain-containing protein [Gammaproteobacteria bacterium]